MWGILFLSNHFTSDISSHCGFKVCTWFGGKIIVYTRNGGGNREDYQEVFDEMETHPLFITDYDDDFDCTYAYYEFKAPQSVNEFFEDVNSENFERVGERFQREMKEMEEGKEPNEQVKNFMLSFLEQINK